ncbi:MAG: protein translocase subunit SecD, partial [Oscillospiraceae bacterium]
EGVKTLSDKINSGALPFKLVTSSFSTISPTLGMGARDAMVLSGLIAFIFIALFMIIYYRLPGTVAVIALIGQIAGMIAVVTGYFGFMNSSTLTVPGIAGIILSIGMGVDANIITSERIKEEIREGKTLDGAISAGYDHGFSAIFDGNVTVVIVAVILMGAFGPPDSIFAQMLKWVFFMFGPSTAGTIYSFGFTLLTGIVFNFIMGVTASRLMLSSISKFKPFRKLSLYGGVKNND